MKRLVPTIATFFLFIAAHAQIPKGSVFLGGNLNGNMQTTETGSNSTFRSKGFTISPVFGKFIKENLVLGAEAGFGLSKYETSHGYEQKTDYYSIGTFLRKYKNLGSSGFYLFIQGGVRASRQEEDEDDPFTAMEDTKRLSCAISLYPGISYAVSRKFHLESGFTDLLSLSYFHEKKIAEIPGAMPMTSKTNGFSLASSLNNASSFIYLGFRVLLSR